MPFKEGASHTEISAGIPTKYIDLGLDFLVNKPRAEQEEILTNNGLPPVYTDQIPPAVERQLWRPEHANADKTFTFPPRTIVLAHSRQAIEVPLDEIWQMEKYLVSMEEGKPREIPLKAHLEARVLHPGSHGVQTYEIYNTNREPYTVYIPHISSVVYRLPLLTPSKIAEEPNGRYWRQSYGDIILGRITRS